MIFYSLRNQLYTVFSLEIFEPFKAPLQNHPQNCLLMFGYPLSLALQVETKLSKIFNCQVTNFCLADDYLNTCITEKIRSTILTIRDTLKTMTENSGSEPLTIASWWSTFSQKLRSNRFIFQVNNKNIWFKFLFKKKLF